jgi:hypothetical protein
VESRESISNAFALIPGIFDKIQQLHVVLCRHRRPILRKLAYSSRVTLGRDVVLGDQSLFF